MGKGVKGENKVEKFVNRVLGIFGSGDRAACRGSEVGTDSLPE
jgi:hypothetical protein